ncbi:competence/damage-inducible protein cinA [Thermodesulfitimonas autotrophica]|uniref:Putative competence-damage inducible protein n=1 Tax=Thermodesulfitimonas autotrophica TaxID=1894989 RepID=A0A3N5BBA2_9THEO|nr:competence/damage-inducible protein A [Thermodesulfitimonas autotrophica]RPF46948.1 competence/damage-inducible protein cinA [Thermodesulfitimonas autotrophica]
MRAEIIFTGTELLLGQVLNTHAQCLGQELAALGVEIVRHTTVGDDWEGLTSALREALRRADLIITTGGLGPTSDDLTLAAVADVLGLPLVRNETVLSWIKEYFARRGQAVPENLTRQAYFPEGAIVLPNAAGTAPGCIVEKEGKIIVSLPGPPRELTPMFEDHVVPFLSKRLARGGVLNFRVVRVTGIAEYAVQDLLRDLEGKEKVQLGYIAKPGEVHVRIAAVGRDAAEAQQLVARMLKEVRARLGDYIFAYDEESIEEVAGKLLAAKGYTIAVAESCTAGMVAARLTDVPGSSAYFMGGIVAYDNKVKEKILGVQTEILRDKGAVSPETAAAMAEGVRRLLCTDTGIGITGIAGPTGGTPEKPVGLVYIAVAVPGQTVVKKYNFPGRRFAVRQGAANAALKMLRDLLENDGGSSP